MFFITLTPYRVSPPTRSRETAHRHTHLHRRRTPSTCKSGLGHPLHRPFRTPSSHAARRPEPKYGKLRIRPPRTDIAPTSSPPRNAGAAPKARMQPTGPRSRLAGRRGPGLSVPHEKESDNLKALTQRWDRAACARRPPATNETRLPEPAALIPAGSFSTAIRLQDTDSMIGGHGTPCARAVVLSSGRRSKVLGSSRMARGSLALLVSRFVAEGVLFQGYGGQSLESLVGRDALSAICLACARAGLGRILGSVSLWFALVPYVVVREGGGLAAKRRIFFV